MKIKRQAILIEMSEKEYNSIKDVLETAVRKQSITVDYLADKLMLDFNERDEKRLVYAKRELARAIEALEAFN